MALTLDPETQVALDAAKRYVPLDGELEIAKLLVAVLHHTSVKDAVPPSVVVALPSPQTERPSTPDRVDVAGPLQVLLAELAEGEPPVTPVVLFRALVDSSEGRSALGEVGVDPDDVLRALGPGPTGTTAPISTNWRESAAREEAIEALNAFGRFLTDGRLPRKAITGMEKSLRELETTLLKMGRHNAVIHGPPGCGKSALVYEFAGRISDQDPGVPKPLRNLDIFELSPTLLRAGASMVGEYDKRVSALIEVLELHPNIVLFVDELHSLFQSGMQHQGPFTQANETFKDALGKGRISCIGCTTTAEYRHYIEPDGALKRRFDEIKLDQPSPEATLSVLHARLPRLREHFVDVEIREELMRTAIDLTEEHLPALFQPAKSIQLVDRACAMCLASDPPLDELTEEVLVHALESTIGRSLLKPSDLDVEWVYEQLRSKILGQDGTLRELASAFVGGMGSWRDSKGPRGRWMFFGPTGVGKTETAKVLAKILGGGDREALLRIDCNTIQGSGHDSAPSQSVLLGAPPGYRDHGPGLLSRIRDTPECIVLFDEIEKADPGVGKVILQILDEGRVHDATGALLDFRRSFVVFTTNAGAAYDEGLGRLGFRQSGATRSEAPSTQIEDVMAELRATGHGEEFLGRHLRFLCFKGLDAGVVRPLIERQLQTLKRAAEARGYTLTWEPQIIDYLAAQWQPRFGVRHLTTILRHRIEEQLSVGEAQGELRGVTDIVLAPWEDETRPEGVEHVGMAIRERRDRALVIRLA